MSTAAPSTSIGLLARLGSPQGDADAWTRFVYLYGPQVLAWCRHYGLQDSDAEDVAQDVLLSISKRIGRFEYDATKRFRGWLRKLVHTAWCDWVERINKVPRASGDSRVIGILEMVPARDDLIARIEDEYERELLEAAMARVRKRVQPQTWEAFRLLALEGLSGQEAAVQLGMRTGSAHAAKCKVQRLIREEVERMDEC